ncbi:MAG: type II toxin-antitoxin system MqsA family antitoxin [Eubacteriales bacterium]|nr:type II toxin-antitoxin system MqsA family antitoxin [Eubacteriales bacterium]
MKCMECGGRYINTTRTHVVDMKSYIIIIRNVPCLECVQCGDAIYTDAVATRLDDIVQSMKNFMGEIAVVEYTDNRAA